MSESVASALEFLDNDNTRETRLFIRMIDRFFDYLNVQSPLAHQLKQKVLLLTENKMISDLRYLLYCICIDNIYIV